MTDREKMKEILNGFWEHEPSFTEIVLKYLRYCKLDLYEHNQFYNEIHKNYMLRMQELQKCIGIAKEKAQYVCLYLKGEMYTTKEAAIECLPLQIKHAEKVVEMLDDK